MAEPLQSFQKGINLERLRHGRYTELISRVRKAGIVFFCGFVLGNDEDDRSVFQATLEFIQSSHIDVLQVTKPTPLPGTQLWKELQKAGRILDQDFPEAWNQYRLSRLVFKPAQMTIEEVYEGTIYLRKIYHSFWETLKRLLYTFLSTKSLISTIMAYKFDSSYRKAFRNSELYRLYDRPDLKKKFISHNLKVG